MSKTVEELRTWLDRRLGAQEGFEVLWQQLEQDHYIGEFRQGEIDEDEVLRKAREKVSAARRLVHAFGGQVFAPQKWQKDDKEEDANNGKPDEQYFEVDLNDYERERARAYEEILAREAALSQGPDGSFPIINWRQRFLGDRLLALEEAHQLLESPAARFFHLGMFRDWDIPLLRHKAEVMAYDSGAGKPYIDHRATLRIDPPGVVKTVYYADQDKAGFDPDSIDWNWYVHRGNKDDGITPEERILHYKDRDGLKEKMWVWPGSVLDVLRSTSSHWARILGWEEEEMTMWLLTGEPAEWNPLEAKVRYKTGKPLTVTLTIHPWMSAETVTRNYRKIQHQLFGRDNRPLQPRSLAVLRFVEGRIRQSGGERPSWARLVNEWNEQCRPEWQYENRSNLSRTYREALHSVAHSSFSVPFRRVSPALQRKMKRLDDESKAAVTRVFKELAEHGYTARKYDFRGNLLSESETPPKQTPADLTEENVD